MKKLICKIGKDGQITIDAEGFKGKACAETTRKYIEGLGAVAKEEKKPEYYEKEQVTVNC